MEFLRRAAMLLGIKECAQINISEEELRDLIINKLRAINAESEARATHDKFIEDTYDMSDRERRAYIDSWNGGS